MKYPLFPFEHEDGRSPMYHLDINRPFKIIQFMGCQIEGYILRRSYQNIQLDTTWALGTPEELQKKIDDFKEHHDFNNQFEEKIK